MIYDIYPWNNDLTKTIDTFNNIKTTNDFIYVLENINIFLYLNILLINNKKLKFKVHHKSTNDHIFTS